MNAEGIDFLRLFRRGVNPDELFQHAQEANDQQVEEEQHAAVDDHLARQEGLERQVNGLMNQLEAIHVGQRGQERVEARQREVRELQTIQHEVRTTLATKQTELQKQRKVIAHLAQDLATLREATRHLPAPEESSLLKFGKIATSKIGRT